MTSEKFKDQCSDITKEFNVHIPRRLAERVEAYASMKPIFQTRQS